MGLPTEAASGPGTRVGHLATISQEISLLSYRVSGVTHLTSPHHLTSPRLASPHLTFVGVSPGASGSDSGSAA